jgi:hypothetical protein
MGRCEYLGDRICLCFEVAAEAVVLSVALLASHTRSAFCSRFQALSLPSIRDTFFSSYSILRRLLFSS